MKITDDMKRTPFELTDRERVDREQDDAEVKAFLDDPAGWSDGALRHIARLLRERMQPADLQPQLDSANQQVNDLTDQLHSAYETARQEQPAQRPAEAPVTVTVEQTREFAADVGPSIGAVSLSALNAALFRFAVKRAPTAPLADNVQARLSILEATVRSMRDLCDEQLAKVERALGEEPTHD